MIVQCQNCEKKFLVNDNDIPKSGRLLQCGYCSTKWFYKPELIKKEIKTQNKIINPSEVEKVNRVKKKIKKIENTKENKENGLGFFGYIIILLIIFLSAIGFIETFKENIIVFWPNVDNQLNFIYETFDNMTTIVKDILKSY